MASLPAGFPAMTIAEAHRQLTAPGQTFEMEECEVRGVRMRVWKKAPPTLRDIFEAGRAHGPRTHLVYQHERVTFDAHRAAALQLARRLRADGVGAGDRVVIAMRNLPEWSAAFWAGVLVGAIVTPLNAWWTGPELEYGVRDSGARLAIVDAERWERLRERVDACPALEATYVSRAGEGTIADPRARRLEEVIGPPPAWADLPMGEPPDVARVPDDDLAIFYTSGTTGLPKGAVASHRNVVSNMFNAMLAQARAFLRRGEAPPPPDPNAPPKALLVSVPFFHATGCFAILVPAMLMGSKLVLQRRFDAEDALALIQRERITNVGGVPTIAWQLLEHPRFGEFDLSSIQAVSYGGAPSAPELVRRIVERLPHAQPGQGWGMTETSATATTNFGDDYVRKPHSCGVPAPVIDAKVVDGTGHALPPHEVGELMVKGPIVVRGYWSRPEATADTFVDGWVRSGDLARMDEEGFITIVDRAKDMLIRGGENIYCVEVENALYEHPAVMEAAVVAISHPTLGEEPGAVVYLKPGAQVSEAELRQFAAQKLAAFKVPVRIAFWPESLPRNANGKLLKRELGSAFA
jgi:long-chain acyl-CoA synthetase